MKIFTFFFIAGLLFTAIFGGEAFPQDYAQGYFRYKVREGDTLEGILLNIGHSREALGGMIEAAAVRNGLESPDRILADKYLWIPAVVEAVENEIYYREELVLKILEGRMESLELALEEVKQNSADAKTLEPILKDLGKNEKYLIQILESLQKQQEGTAFQFGFYWLLAFGIAIMAFAFLISGFGRHILKKTEETIQKEKDKIDAELKRAAEFSQEFETREFKSKTTIKHLLYWIKDYLSEQLKEVGRDPSELVQRVEKDVNQLDELFKNNRREKGGN